MAIVVNLSHQGNQYPADSAEYPTSDKSEELAHTKIIMKWGGGGVVSVCGNGDADDGGGGIIVGSTGFL